MFAFVMIAICAIVLESHAQAWQWGRKIAGLGDQRVVNGYVVRSDNCNNISVAGIWKSDSIKIGVKTYYNHHVGHNNYECYIAKYDSSGNVLWSDASILGQALPYSLATDKNGNTYLYGCFWTDSVQFGSHLLVSDYPDSCLLPWCMWGNGCYFIIKYDPVGNILWSRKGDIVMGLGGGIVLDDAGNIYVSGTYWNATMKIGSDTLYNSSYKKGEVFLAKYDTAGNAVWARKYGDTADENTSGITIANNKIYLAGQFKSPILSLGSSTLTLHTTVPAYNIGNVYLMQLDTAGNPLWARSARGSAVPFDIAADSIGGIYIGGQIFDTTLVSFNTDTLRNAHLRWGGFVTRYDSAGDVTWARGLYNTTTTLTTYGFGQGNRLWSVAVDPCNNVWVSGAISGDTGGILIDSGVILHAPLGSWDPLYLISYSYSGDLLQSQSLRSGSDNGGKVGLTCTPRGQVLLSSNFTGGTLIFGPDTLSSSGSAPMFLAKYNPALGCTSTIVCSDGGGGGDITAVSSFIFRDDFSLYPNPAHNELHIKPFDAIANISIYNTLGQYINCGVDFTKGVINTSHLPVGIYFIKINGTFVRKFVKG